MQYTTYNANINNQRHVVAVSPATRLACAERRLAAMETSGASAQAIEAQRAIVVELRGGGITWTGRAA